LLIAGSSSRPSACGSTMYRLCSTS
jgi:hypothetical protein